MLAAAPAANATTAARRRQRRLRQFLRHERLTVAMLLAERDHHTAPRGLKQARSGGVEREVNYEPRLLDPPLPQEAATVGYVAAPVPLLAQPVLGGGNTLDAAAVQFLLVQSLLQRQRDEEEAAQRLVKEAEEAKEKEERKAKFEEKMLVVNRRVRDGTATPAEEAAWRRWMGLVPGSSSSSSGKRRKRKKRRKRRTPRTSSLPGRARRRHRQWFACSAGFYW